ncbi:HNH endonuclease [Selenomonas sp. KH1T6]|uniref:HNH endonuclease n=1 Tax=Selenomonas sp. KH1T6 TaxID=3158784 RepID=UPI0008A76759|nr:TIGR02646 family protein [Selenomonas ruminantium]
MVKCNKSKEPPASLAREKLKGANGSCRCDDVINQLLFDFNNKCYICEIKGIADPEVEHLHPHHNSKYLDLKFDWSNLFLSCAHCNKVKNQAKYENHIIDCCQEDPEIHLHSVYKDGNVYVSAIDDSEESQRTAELIYEVFNKETPALRNIASKYRLNALRIEMNNFFKELASYKKDPQNAFHKRRIMVMLKTSSSFAAFKRDYIRDNADTYADLFNQL